MRGFGGNHKGKIIGKGIIGNCTLPFITKFLLVKGIMHNLISISQLIDNGYDIIFNEKSCNIVSQKDDYVLFSGKRKNNMYKSKLYDLEKQNVKFLMLVNE